MEAHLELCKERVLSQEARNREFTTKATGIIAFAAGLFTLSRGVIDWNLLPTWVMVGCLAVVALLALATIVRPRKWATPCDLGLSEGAIKGGGYSYRNYLIAVSKTHLASTNENRGLLASKGTYLTIMAGAAVVELAALLWLIIEKSLH